jgi:hypothetical protein
MVLEWAIGSGCSLVVFGVTVYVEILVSYVYNAFDV